MNTWIKLVSACFLISSLSTQMKAQQMDEMWGKQYSKKINEERGHLFEWGN